MKSTSVSPQPGRKEPVSSERDIRTSGTVLLTGTDPEDPRGGIGVAMAGYMRALEEADLEWELIPSYRPSFTGRWWLPLRAASNLLVAIRRLRRTGRQPIVYAHGGAAIGLLRQSLLLYAVRAAGAVTMLQLHSTRVESYLRSWIGRSFLHLCLSPAHLVCVLTEWWRVRLGQLGGDRSIAVVPNPLPAELERAARQERKVHLRSQPRELRLLTMTRLVSGKGVDLAIRTMRELPATVSLTVAGDGSERSQYEQLADDLGVSGRVRFPGWVSGHEKAELLRSSHVFLLPTQRDALPMSLLEAMAYGLPVVALRWASIVDVVPHEVAGLLVARDDPDLLAEAVGMLMDPNLREQMGRAGQAWVLQRFAAGTVGGHLRTIMTDLLRRGR